MSFATCRGCDRAFTTHGAGKQSAHPRLCHDCAARELAFHGYHAPGMKCLEVFLAKEKQTEGTR